MPCYSPVLVRTKNLSRVQLGIDMLYRRVPCGKCLGCLRARQMQYAFRLEWECLDPSNVDMKFCTFTYAPEFLPSDNELSKLEVQHYVRRLKKYLGDKVRVRYFFCGEHGSPEYTERAHYHAILFFSDYVSESVISRAWSKGRVDIAEVNPRRCGYVAKYSMKQLGDGSDRWSQPPFMLVSNSVGFYFLEKYGDFIRKNYINTWLNASGYSVTLPRIFMERLFPPMDKVHTSKMLESNAAFRYYSSFVGNKHLLDLKRKASYDARVSLEASKKGLSVAVYEGVKSLGLSFLHDNKREAIFNRVKYETGRY